MRDFIFVLEQTLGHVAHTKNLERVVRGERDVDARFVHVPFERSRAWERLPVLSNWSVRASWFTRRRLRRELAERRPDCVFIHTQVIGLMSTGVMHRVPTVVSLDATPLNFDSVGSAYSHSVGYPAVEACKRAINRRALHAAAAVVTWSEWAAASVCNDYGVAPDRVHVIPPGVDTTIFSPVPRTNGGPVRLLFVGGDLERKGGLDLLEAVSGLGDRVEVDLVTGSPPPAIPSGARVRVHLGLQPQSDAIVRLYREADVFVLPARGDCLPQAIAEGMACGLPVIASSIGAIGELVLQGVNGLLVPPGAPDRLARAIAALAANPDLRTTMGRAGLELARSNHDMARNNRSILALMGEVAQIRAVEAPAA